MSSSTESIPNSFTCPISSAIMIDPYIDKEGNSYEKKSIFRWLQTNATSPLTRTPLTIKDLIPNRALKDLIDQWRQTGKFASVERPIMRERTLEIEAVRSIETSDITCKYSKLKNELIAAVTIIPPSTGPRTSVNICCVIDTSISMGAESIIIDIEPIENPGLTNLDIVKHGIFTVIETMTSDDCLCIVQYSGIASVILPLTKMTPARKEEVKELVTFIQSGGQTNLWNGLKMGYAELAKSVNSNPGYILLLTDGRPNINPPRGHISMFNKMLDDTPSMKNIVLNCFGLGCNMDSGLLDSLSGIGNGAYYFIPNIDLLGSVIINCLADIYSTVTNNLCIKINSPVPFKAQWAQTYSKSIYVNIGPMSYGQNRDFVLHFKDKKIKPYLDVIVSYIQANSTTTIELRKSGVPEFDNIYVRNQHYRTRLVDSLFTMYPLKMLEKINNLLLSDHCIETPYITAINKDIYQQILPILYTSELFDKWGEHYIRSIRSAHTLQRCINFKDDGVQIYGGYQFRKYRDQIDDIFCALNPPVKYYDRQYNF